MSDYRLDLLLAIDAAGSLAAAAQAMGLSYRRAWGKVREVERNLGVSLVESAAGGARGGGSRLTPAGRDLVLRYRHFADQARRAVAETFDRVFTPLTGPTDPATLRSDLGGPR